MPQSIFYYFERIIVFWLAINSDRYKRAKVRLESSGGFSGRLPWPALAAGQQKPEQGVATLPKYGKCV